MKTILKETIALYCIFTVLWEITFDASDICFAEESAEKNERFVYFIAN